MRQEFGLIPVEYPTTRKMGSTPQQRAADIHAAFADPEIRAIVSTIGGDDQITVLPHLDAELIKANPKPFLGYSDNTCLLAYLYDLGIVGYYGGADGFPRESRVQTPRVPHSGTLSSAFGPFLGVGHVSGFDMEPLDRAFSGDTGR